LNRNKKKHAKQTKLFLDVCLKGGRRRLPIQKWCQNRQPLLILVTNMGELTPLPLFFVDIREWEGGQVRAEENKNKFFGI
jgi:hypothetical protein